MKYRVTINDLRFFSSLQTIFKPHNHHHHHQHRTITKVRLKWVKNRSLDNIIDIHTDLKAACLLKDAIIHRPSQFLTAKSISDTQKLLGITVPTLRFIRRYPTLFEEFPHPKYPNLPCFRLTNIALNLHKLEQRVYEIQESKIVERLCRVLMMSRDKQLPLQSLHPLRWDLGFPYDYDKTLAENHSDKFQVVKDSNGRLCVKLEKWVDEFAVSDLQKSNEIKESRNRGDDYNSYYRTFTKGQTLAFPLSFPRGYGAQKKVKSWMDEFQKLPYISPYEDSSSIDPNSELMEKRIVGVLHEFLSLTVYKKTKRNYLRNLTDEYNMPFRFTRIFTRYPGIFYLSLKCKTTSVALKEGYRRGKLVNPCEIAKYRGKFHHVMRIGLVYRKKGLEMLPELDKFGEDDVIGIDGQDSLGDEEVESSGEWVDCEDEDEEFDDVSDQD